VVSHRFHTLAYVNAVLCTAACVNHPPDPASTVDDGELLGEAGQIEAENCIVEEFFHPEQAFGMTF